MAAKLAFQASARKALQRCRKDDPGGIDQVLDAINTLKKNPDQGKRMGPDRRRMHVGVYRVIFQLIDEHPVIISIECVGRV